MGAVTDRGGGEGKKTVRPQKTGVCYKRVLWGSLTLFFDRSLSDTQQHTQKPGAAAHSSMGFSCPGHTTLLTN
jgi:hypothetical protein